MFGNSDRSRTQRERSAEERERARLERERLRSTPSSGQSPSDEPVGAEVLSEDRAVEHPPWRVESAPEAAPAVAPPAGRAAAIGGGSTSRRKRRARVAAIAALGGATVLVGLLVALFQPFHGSGEGSVIVDIPRGSSASSIGSILTRRGVVSSGFLFDVRALLEGRRGDLHSGRYRLRRDMSYTAAIDALTKPPPRAIVVKVLVPEGETRLRIARTVRAEDLKGSYLAASTRSALLDPARYGAPKSTPSLEGFLFPATYELVAGAPAGHLVSEQLIAFKQRFGAAHVRRARALGLTPYQLLIVASMIEGEAELTRDRPLVAAVIYNRLRLGIPLGIDATIRYALNDYTHPLTEAQLRSDSPYNTRLHRGLPPTPIGNPGMAGIEAAAHPAHVSYLYYVAGADGCGELVFSKSYSQFLGDAAAYRAAVDKNGGKVPLCRR